VFKLFIEKYAILNKCEEPLFMSIAFFLSSSTDEVMSKQNYLNFIENERSCFALEPETQTEEIFSK
jgi:hypothetical protein